MNPITDLIAAAKNLVARYCDHCNHRFSKSICPECEKTLAVTAIAAAEAFMEPVELIDNNGSKGYGCWCCGDCSNSYCMPHFNFCPGCGKPIKRPA